AGLRASRDCRRTDLPGFWPRTRRQYRRRGVGSGDVTSSGGRMTIALLTVAIRRETDILLARQRARQISQFLGFSEGDTTRITTALSEVVRNAYEYAGGGSAA